MLGRKTKAEPADAPQTAPVAVVGMSCRFAGASDPGALWRMLMAGRSAIETLPNDVALPIGCRNLLPDRTYPSSAGQLGDLYSCLSFEQRFPRALNCGENQDAYFISQLAIDALADAGMRPHVHETVRGTLRLGYAPVFTSSGVNWLGHTFFVEQTMEIARRFFPGAPVDALEAVCAKLRESLPAPDGGAFGTALPHRVADAVARACSFSGSATVMDAGSLTGVEALCAAADDLRRGDADVALVGAVTPPYSRAELAGLSGVAAFSPDRSLTPFDRDAHGTIPGEGGAFFVLKRRADALAAHDRIYALVRAGASGTGAASLALAAEQSRLPLASVAMVEADGSGVPEADAAEVAELQELWGEHKPGGPLVGIGSVKGNLGHCFTASAAAGLVKTALSLHRRVLAPQVAPAHPLEALSRLDSSVYLLDRPRPWITGDPASPRRAAVLARGDGRSAAVLLEEEPEVRA